MMANLKYWLKGLAVAALSMVVYAGALGCYIALMLLVISMEEGGDNLSAFSVSLTEAVVLLSQGNGFKTGSITLTIMPLLLTVLLIALIASLAKRVGTSLSGCVAGTIGWVLINVFFANSLDIKLVDTTGVVAVKTAIVFVLGYAIALTRGLSLEKRVYQFSVGASNKNIILMIWIFILAGAFAQSAKQMGAIDATVNLTLSILPDNLLLAGIFIAACFISLSIGTSVGTIVALTPVAIGLAEKTGIDLPYMVAI